MAVVVVVAAAAAAVAEEGIRRMRTPPEIIARELRGNSMNRVDSKECLSLLFYVLMNQPFGAHDNFLCDGARRVLSHAYF